MGGLAGGAEVGEGFALDFAAEEGVEAEVNGGGGEGLDDEDGEGVAEPGGFREEVDDEGGEIEGCGHGGEGEGDVGGDVSEHQPDAAADVTRRYQHGGDASYGCSGNLSPQEDAYAEGDVGAVGEGECPDGGYDGGDGYAVTQGLADDEHP